MKYYLPMIENLGFRAFVKKYVYFAYLKNMWYNISIGELIYDFWRNFKKIKTKKQYFTR